MNGIEINCNLLRTCRVLISVALFCLLIGYNVTPVTGAVVDDYSALPPFLTTDVTPNVMFMLDNSGSMKHSLYDGDSWRCRSYATDFDPDKDYYGLFDETKTYRYDITIPVDLNGYNGSSVTNYRDGGGTLLSYDIDVNGDGLTDAQDVATAPGAFVEETCVPATGVNCWDGNFLNWMVTRRIDAARKVLIGGKVESRAGYDYTGSGTTEWKIVANNERSDYSICKKDDNALRYSPYPVDSDYQVLNPAESGATLATAYDPYAKLYVTSPAVVIDSRTLLDSDGNIIGETGIIRDLPDDKESNSWHTVNLMNSYVDPIVVVATPPTYNGADPAVVRIRNVDTPAGTFQIRVEEWDYLAPGSHASEDVSFFVLKAGTHTLPGGENIVAGTAEVNASGWLSVDISGVFAAGSTPVVLSSVVTANQQDTVTTRQRSVASDSFDIVLQEEQDYPNNGDGVLHPDETVAYLALQQGRYTAGDAIYVEVGVATGVDEDWSTISFAGAMEPHFLASMQTYNGADPAALRYRNLTPATVQVFVEEEASADDEVGHADENVGYVVIGSPPYNIALLVDEEPTGLLHEVVDQVRLGISFYKYNKDSDIYNGETIHGGTMHLNIPLNPFVKDPDAVTATYPDATTGYRQVSTPVKTNIANIVDAIEHYPLVWGTTPLAENYFEVIRYFQQVAPYYNSTVNSGNTDVNYLTNDTWDPYYFEDPNGDGDNSDATTIDCAQSYILLFTDGFPFKDGYVPDTLSGYDFSDFDEDSNSEDCFTTAADNRDCEDNLNDLSKWAHCAEGGSTRTCSGDYRDLRSDLDGEQNLTTYTVTFGESTVRQILQETADYGGGIAYAAEDGGELDDQLTNAFDAILGRSSGTAASVISNTRSGEGAIYQSVFFPQKIDDDDDTEVNWVGQVHALLVDAYGFMHEDTNTNKELDLLSDRIVTFRDNGSADLYVDANGNRQFDAGELDENVPLDDLEYLWNTSSWLNEISDTNVEFQRSTYLSDSANRYIFTWIDGDNDALVDVTPTSEVINFDCLADPSAADLIDPTKIFPYLHLYPSFVDTPTEISGLITADFDDFLIKQSCRQINYIRGSDCVDSSDTTTCNTSDLITANGTTVTGSAMRSRQFDYDGDDTLETWRLGDIIYSTPTLVGRPAEAFHLLYRDSSYAPFAAKYNKRRSVIYAGANDGMVHAFNGGFFHSPTNAFCRELNLDYDPFVTDDNQYACMEDPDATSLGTTMPELGAELWAYVPFKLLPHLYWLTQTTYDQANHVYYVDQKPRIFDAKIFPEENTSCRSGADADGVNGPDLDQLENLGCVHPNGWGTVMVIGMRFGGGSIVADLDKTDGNSAVAADPTMKSAYMIFDITNPEIPPKLLAELTMPNMGFATSFPTVAVMNDGDHDGDFEDYDSLNPEQGENRWFLAFGSGPADVNGDPGGIDSAGEYDRTILESARSLQQARFYMVDLVKLVSENALFTLDNSGNLTSGLNSYVILDDNSFVSDPVTVDYDLDYNADVLYFGTISGENTATTDFGGKLRRIVIDDIHDNDEDQDPTNWVADNVLMDVGQPITAAAAVGLDDDGSNWVYFGTGRYFVEDDKTDLSLQSFYGIKEPLDLDNYKTWATLNAPDLSLRTGGDLLNVTNFQVFEDETVNADGTTQTFDELETDQLTYDGWYLDFYADDLATIMEGERNLGQAALIGGLLSFTTFIPSDDECEVGGNSDLWALYYKTGTAYFSGVLGFTDPFGGAIGTDRAKRSIGEGTDGVLIRGLATSPNIHVGREEGSVVFVQSSTGEIKRIEEDNPLSTKSGVLSWKLR